MLNKKSCWNLIILLASIGMMWGCGNGNQNNPSTKPQSTKNKCGTSVCKATEYCKTDVCVTKGCNTGGPKCTGAHEICYNDQCIQGTACKKTTDCTKALGQGYICQSNFCREQTACVSKSDCVVSKDCKYKTCVSPNACRLPSDCSKEGETCIAGTCGVPNEDKCSSGGKNIVCGPLELCTGGVCVPTCAPTDTCLGKCTADPTQKCTSLGWKAACPTGKLHCETATGPVCCGAQEACINSQCIKVESDCDFTQEKYCKIGQYCEQSVKKCVTFTDNPGICGYTPSSSLDPQLKIKWTDQPVFATPIVINLDDDNGDGLVNDQDIPEIAFVTYDKSSPQLVVLHGKPLSGTDPDVYWKRTLPSGNVAYNIAPAAGDLDGDGKPEIIVAKSDHTGRVVGLYAFHSDGTKYKEGTFDASTISNNSIFAASIAIADINGDGKPEVIALGNVFNNELIYSTYLNDYKPRQSDIPVIADMNMNGCLDIVVGRRVYDCEITDSTNGFYAINALNMTGENTPAPSPKQGAIAAAVANLQGDDKPEIVSVEAANSQTSKGKIYITDNTGKIIYETEGPDGTSRGGAPTIADFNGDGEPNIGIAFDKKYVAYKLVKDSSGNITDLSILWEQAIEDFSSAITGSSIFDFQGDGKAEVVYNDENNLYVFSGDGRKLFSTPNSTGTQLENPVIADVDNDGHADIVVVTNPYNSSTEQGIRVFSNNSWVSTRPIWNQAVYNVVNVNRDGTIPRHQKINWQQPWLNNFRQNVQDGNPKLAPDLIIEPQPVFDGVGCATSTSFNIHFKLKNVGSSSVRAGLVNYKVVAKFNDSSSKVLLTGVNTKTLGTSTSDNFEDIVQSYTRDSSFSGKGVFNLEFIVDETNIVSECKDNNNKAVLSNIGAGAPDASVLINSVLTDNCNSEGFVINLQVSNTGAVGLPAGVKVDLYSYGSGVQKKKIATLTTKNEIPAGASEQLTYKLLTSVEYQNHGISFEAIVDPDNDVEECNEKNNSIMTLENETAICYVLG